MRIMFVPDNSLGRTVVGCAMFARGSGLEQWDKAVHSRYKEVIQETHTLNTIKTQINGNDIEMNFVN